ncbi:MAG: pyridoxamine 5'-phosphate oxidase [Rhodospirillaceae bacterium]|nr:pyridoxamine 5'-phosphate oxidase [Rhodospirillaceae bacterium]
MSITPTPDPIDLFRDWFEAATEREPSDPNAMALATVDAEGRPSLRMVLLKGADAGGFVFYTNFESRKGRELLETKRAALCFHWKSLKRQVRVEGRVAPVADAEADAYFASRDRGSQIGAWASLQSQPLGGKMELMGRVAKFAAQFGVGAVPRPQHWSGFRIVPERLEFWQDGRFRLHDRLVYERRADGWATHNLYP